MTSCRTQRHHLAASTPAGRAFRCSNTAFRHRRVKVAHGYALVPDLVAGTLAWGFTSLATVLFTNLGTYGIYSRTTASLHSLDRQIARSHRPGTRIT